MSLLLVSYLIITNYEDITKSDTDNNVVCYVKTCPEVSSLQTRAISYTH